jgi:hypothetical protein
MRTAASMTEAHNFDATVAGISVMPAADPIPAGFITPAVDVMAVTRISSFTAALSARLSPASRSVV